MSKDSTSNEAINVTIILLKINKWLTCKKCYFEDLEVPNVLHIEYDFILWMWD